MADTNEIGAPQAVLAELRPRSRNLVFDLVEKAGVDVTDWRESASDSRMVKANPKYCYEWSYIEPGQLIVLNLWHANMVEEGGQVILRENFRADGERYRTTNHNATWARRAERIDLAVQAALNGNLPVRVIILDGNRRDKSSLDTKPSSVKFRELDPEPWAIISYDWATGATELRRGILAGRYVDQFDLDQADKSGPERREHIGSAFVRNPAVRRRALTRAAGRCEACGLEGFRMESGALYLETHHVIPLGEGGADDDGNVVALCANDHRRAHFAEDSEAIRHRLLLHIQGVKPSDSKRWTN